MTPVQLVGTERGHDQHAVQDLLIADQERQQVTRRPVGPGASSITSTRGPASARPEVIDQTLIAGPLHLHAIWTATPALQPALPASGPESPATGQRRKRSGSQLPISR
jgi:hypothetical protein